MITGTSHCARATQRQTPALALQSLQVSGLWELLSVHNNAPK